MPVAGEVEGAADAVLNQSDTDMPSIPRGTPRTRKVSVQLSEKIFERLEAATDRPGLGKSMVVEAALERFLDPAPPVEGLVHEALHRINCQLQRLDGDIAVIAEAVALHARYHLSVTPAMPQSQQRAACALGHARFKAFAEQVSRRIRSGRPLMRETIDHLSATGSDATVPESDGLAPIGCGCAAIDQQAFDLAAVQEDGSNLSFRHLPNAFC